MQFAKIKRRHNSGYAFVIPADVSAVVDDSNGGEKNGSSTILLKSGKDIWTDEPAHEVVSKLTAIANQR